MNRPKTTARDLPPRMLRRVRTPASGKRWVSYYYNGRDDAGKRKEIPLGGDLNEAKRKWADLECRPAPVETGIMRVVFDRYAVVGLRKRVYADWLGKHQHRGGQPDRQQRSHSSPPPHCPRQCDLSPQPVDAGGAAGIPGSLLGFNGSDTPVGVGVHVRSVR